MNVAPDFDLLSQLLEHFEGYYENAYQDSGGVWTLGYGSTYNFDAGRRVRKGDKITRAKALEYVSRECTDVVRYANQYIRRKLNAHQSTAIVDYIYNRGIGNFLKTNLDELINANPDDPAIRKEILGTGLWDRLGNKLWGLGRRRRAEAHLYFTGALKFDWKRW